ncbi:MAG: hypothetical protein ACXU8U_02620 [Asticcacaulis sp.]
MNDIPIKTIVKRAKPAEKPAAERPVLITPAEFAAIADLAWREDPRGSLAKQVSAAIGVSESSVERWLKDERHPAPPDRIAQALAAANKRLHEKADLLIKIAGVLAQNPDA